MKNSSLHLMIGFFAFSASLVSFSAFAQTQRLEGPDALDVLKALENNDVPLTHESEVTGVQVFDVICVIGGGCSGRVDTRSAAPHDLILQPDDSEVITAVLRKSGIPTKPGDQAGFPGRKIIRVKELDCNTGPFNGEPICDLQIDS